MTTFSEACGSVEALRQAIAAGYVKPGRDELATLALAGEIDRLRAELAALRADAARYRWLRDYSEPALCAFYLSVGKAFDGVRFTRETVDAAISDQIAAMAAHKEHGA